MIATIMEDIFSNAKKTVQYASKGEKVRIVADFVNVAIVEDKHGVKFPVPKKKLFYENKEM